MGKYELCVACEFCVGLLGHEGRIFSVGALRLFLSDMAVPVKYCVFRDAGGYQSLLAVRISCLRFWCWISREERGSLGENVGWEERWLLGKNVGREERGSLGKNVGH